MEPTETNPDPAFEAEVLAYDEALAQGRPPAVAEDLPATVLGQRVTQARACLERLERDRRETATDSVVELVRLLHAEGLLENPTLTDAKFGRFRLVRELGRGGCGIVFLAWDPVLRRHIALKIPRLDVLVRPEARQRFVREGRAAAGLAHPNIVSVFEAGEVGTVSYIASAYCPGPSLARWLKEQTAPVPQHVAAQLVTTVALALQHAHERGLIHRDLKPGNLLLEPIQQATVQADGEIDMAAPPSPLAMFVPKLTDFGLAKRIVAAAPEQDGAAPVRTNSEPLTHTGHGLGTPAYMAPEQAAGRTDEVGPTIDIWALGVILYELLTGQAPFKGVTEMDTLQQVIAADPVAPRRLRGDLARDLEVICLKCLQPLPQRRYRSMVDLADDLQRFEHAEPIQARPASALERGMLWVRRQPALAALVASGMVALLVLLAGMLWHFEQLDARNSALQAAVARANEERARAETGEQLAHAHAYAALISFAEALRTSGRPGLLRESLGRLAPASKESDLRGFEWHYLWNVGAREIHFRSSSARSIHAVAFLADGRRCVAVDRVGAAVIWNIPQARIVAHWDGNPMAHGDQVFSADGSRFVSVANDGDGQSIRLCDLAGRRIIAARTWPDVHTAVLSSDGRTIAFRGQKNAEGEVRLWEPEFNRERLLWQESATAVTALAFAPDGATLAIAYLQARDPEPPHLGIECIEVATGRRRLALVEQGPLILSLAFSPDSAVLASGRQSGLVKVWDVATGAARATLRDLEGVAHSLAFSMDGRLLAAGSASAPGSKSDGFVCVWDLSKGGGLHVPPWRRDVEVTSLAFSATGTVLLVGDAARRVCLFDFDAKAAEEILPGHGPKEAWSVAFTPDGATLISGGDDHLVKLWDVRTGTVTSTLTEHGSLVSSVAVSPDGRRWASASYDATVKVWDAASRKCLCTLPHAGPVWSAAFGADGRTLASTGRDGSATLWNTDTGTELRRLPRHPSRLYCAFLDDGKALALGSGDGSVKIWDVATGACRSVHEGASNVHGLALSANGRLLAAGSAEGTIALRSAVTGEHVAVLEGHSKLVRAIAFSPDGKTLASGSEDRTVRLWHVATGQELVCFKDLPHQVNSVAFSPDGSTLAAAIHDGSIRFWRAHDSASR